MVADMVAFVASQFTTSTWDVGAQELCSVVLMAKELVSDDSDDEDVGYKGDLGIPDADDCATGSFCSSCAIPPRVAGGLWSAGVGCDACYFPFGVIRFRRRG